MHRIRNHPFSSTALAVIIALIAWGIWDVWPSHASHHATCWKQNGVIGYEGQNASPKYVPIYKHSGTRHGKGPKGFDVCNQGHLPTG